MMKPSCVDTIVRTHMCVDIPNAIELIRAIEVQLLAFNVDYVRRLRLNDTNLDHQPSISESDRAT